MIKTPFLKTQVIQLFPVFSYALNLLNAKLDFLMHCPDTMRKLPSMPLITMTQSVSLIPLDRRVPYLQIQYPFTGKPSS
jgi:hypothetical protein